MSYKDFWQPLTRLYDEAEAKAVARMLMEVHYGLSLTDIVSDGIDHIDEKELQKLQQRLLAGEPVQYVIGVADFGPRTFKVAPGVLIPRPETFRLCEMIIAERKQERLPLNILDIGTGSGCIACTLAAELPESQVTAWDVAEEALASARENALRNRVHISVERHDALDPPPPHISWDIIVSNPPYVCLKEAASMEHHVLDYEPHTALFVPDDDPLLFYRSISDYASKTLARDGSLYFEINPLFVTPIETLLREKGFEDIAHHDDQFGKTRFIKATNL